MQLSSEQYSYMTDYIKRRYGYSADWCKKVNKMPDDQVFAIFCSVLARERLERQQLNKKTRSNVVEPIAKKSQTGEQLTIWDLISEGGTY